ncbi:putative hemerythrin-like metal-binding protein [Magnetofaba australis IT-1]|uniref:Hemerythrin-like metal-binding protein n=1 Tax=Magnetofaba australis IT-1 TaxID=1434232 RepID=W0LN75_9PROT|nr:hemerythrin-like metal-binding protein [Magnetofaba australis IT-1]OSM08649.1 putative hemerythrin-like metal-binding protein [Magnetofaba australis IT-1]
MLDIDVIDLQHAVLFDLIELMQEGESDVEMCINTLGRYTAMHFKFEESLMRSERYVEHPQHLEMHQEFEARSVQFKQELQQAQSPEARATLLNEVLVFVRDWLIKHIDKVDRHLFSDKNLYTLPSE